MMNLTKYGIPNYYKNPLDLLIKNKIEYVLFKQTQDYNKNISGLDILFTNKDYKKALFIFKKEGFIVYLSEKNEPDKTMLVKFNKKNPIILHMHKEIGWLGFIFLDKNRVFNQKINLNKYLKIPSKTHSVLIHAGHIIYENFKIKSFEKEIFLNYYSNSDKKEIQYNLDKFHWDNEFKRFIKNLNIKFKLKDIFFNYFKILFYQPKNLLKLIKQILNYIKTRLNISKKGILISFCGPNGSGKSTSSKKLSKQYQLFLKDLALNVNLIYFGWKPFTPWMKIISRNIGKTSYNPTKEANKEKEYSFSIKKELFFLIIFIEDLIRYYFLIYPKLMKRNLVITDRYFYRMKGLFPYSIKGVLPSLLLKLFPQPDFLYIFKIAPSTLKFRRQNKHIKHLKNQGERYSLLSCTKIIKEYKNLEEDIIKETFNKYILRVGK